MKVTRYMYFLHDAPFDVGEDVSDFWAEMCSHWDQVYAAARARVLAAAIGTTWYVHSAIATQDREDDIYYDSTEWDY